MTGPSADAVAELREHVEVIAAPLSGLIDRARGGAAWEPLASARMKLTEAEGLMRTAEARLADAAALEAEDAA